MLVYFLVFTLITFKGYFCILPPQNRVVTETHSFIAGDSGDIIFSDSILLSSDKSVFCYLYVRTTQGDTNDRDLNYFQCEIYDDFDPERHIDGNFPLISKKIYPAFPETYHAPFTELKMFKDGEYIVVYVLPKDDNAVTVNMCKLDSTTLELLESKNINKNIARNREEDCSLTRGCWFISFSENGNVAMIFDTFNFEVSRYAEVYMQCFDHSYNSVGPTYLLLSDINELASDENEVGKIYEANALGVLRTVDGFVGIYWKVLNPTAVDVMLYHKRVDHACTEINEESYAIQSQFFPPSVDVKMSEINDGNGYVVIWGNVYFVTNAPATTTIYGNIYIKNHKGVHEYDVIPFQIDNFATPYIDARFEMLFDVIGNENSFIIHSFREKSLHMYEFDFNGNQISSQIYSFPFNYEYNGMMNKDYFHVRYFEYEKYQLLFSVGFVERSINGYSYVNSYLMNYTLTADEYINVLKGDVETLNQENAILKGEIGFLEGEISTLNKNVNGLEGEISSLKQNITVLEEELDLCIECADNAQCETGQYCANEQYPWLPSSDKYTCKNKHSFNAVCEKDEHCISNNCNPLHSKCIGKYCTRNDQCDYNAEFCALNTYWWQGGDVINSCRAKMQYHSPCVHDFHCELDLFCAQTETWWQGGDVINKCRTRINTGGPCIRDGNCATDLYCAQTETWWQGGDVINRCRTKIYPGGPCIRDENCESDLYCAQTETWWQGGDVINRCRTKIYPGGPCIRDDNCENGLICVNSLCSS